jgi:hypothetical protein
MRARSIRRSATLGPPVVFVVFVSGSHSLAVNSALQTACGLANGAEIFL